MFLAIIVFIVPLCTGLYIWRENEPPRIVYVISFMVSFAAMLLLFLGISSITTLMGIGIFLASTSFFAGTFMSLFVRAYRNNKADN
jgi:drug/metabolite transporter (DMT)-like permease